MSQTRLDGKHFLALVYISICIYCLPTATWALSDKRLCADPKCERIISFGTSVLTYGAPEEGLVSFKINSPIRILSKSAGSDKSLWGVEVNGRRGYANKKFIRESKVVVPDKDLQFEVPVTLPGQKPSSETVKPPEPLSVAAKPVEEQPVLNASESIEVKIDGLDESTTTTTSPLEVNVNSDQPIINTNAAEANVVQPVQTTPVKQKGEIVDGTLIPIEELTLNDEKTANEQLQLKETNDKETHEIETDELDDDDDDFDYEEDEAELDNDVVDTHNANNSKLEQMPTNDGQAKPIATNAENSVVEKAKLYDAKVGEPIKDEARQNEVQQLTAVNAKALKEATEQVSEKNVNVEVVNNTTESVAVDVNTTPEQDKSESILRDASTEKAAENIVPVATFSAQDNGNTTKEIQLNEKKTQEHSTTQAAENKEATQAAENKEATQAAENKEATQAAENKEATQAAESYMESVKQTAELNLETAKQSAKPNIEAATQEVQQKVETGKQSVEQNIEAATQEVSTLSQAVQQNIEAASQEVQLNVETTTLAATQNVEAVSQEVQQNVETSTQATQQNIEAASQEVRQNDETSTQAATQNVETATQSSMQNVETETQTGEKIIESTSPAAKLSFETITQPAEQNIETVATQASELKKEEVLNEANGASLNAQPIANTKEESETVLLNSSTNETETHTEQTQETTIQIPSIANNTHDVTVQSLTAEVVTETDQVVTEPLPVLTESQQPQAHLNGNLDRAQVPETEREPSDNDAIKNEAENQAPSPNDEQQKSADQIQVEQTTAASSEVPSSSLPPLFRQTQFDSNTVDEIVNQQHDKLMGNQNNNNENDQTIALPTGQEEAESRLPLKTDKYDYTTPTYDSPITANDEPTLAPGLAQNYININNNVNNDDAETTENVGVGSVESVDVVKTQTDEPIVMPSTSTPTLGVESLKDDDGLFATILGTVNSFLSNNQKEKNLREDYEAEHELDRILYPERTISKQKQEELLDSSTCIRQQANTEQSPISLDNFIEVLAAKVLDNSQLLLCLTVAAASSLFFVFGYYCFCNSSNEGALLAKLNQLERSLLAAHKENSILKHDLMTTRTKLSSIEDNSFGSNDMVISLKKQLEEELLEKAKLQEQVKSLEKDLVSAADAGLELNKYVSELLANQNGDESIKDTIEELQRQLNEQDHTIREINGSLAEKSRENSELQLSLAEQNARLTSDLSILQQDNDELEAEKSNLQTRIEELTTEFEQNLNKALEGKNYEIQRMQNHILDINSKWEREHNELQTSFAKIEALEDCLKTLKKDSGTNMDELINAAKLRGELLAMQKKHATLKAQLNSELESKALTENQLKSISDEIEKLKKEFNQSEKEKLDAQTRLEVLSNYFKEKEAHLQKELNAKEAMWLKQQGENTGTVDKITGMQEEIQTLKSQNEELRAEIEAQVASHKAQTGILQSRVHEHYLSARQAERRCDEARNEAAILRSRLTAMANGNAGDQASNASGNELPNKTENKDAPSPLPGSPFFPPPLPFLPPQAFLGTPAAHFMGLPPPPPFLPPPEDLRPAPLGRMRSPTTRSGRYSPSDSRRSGRYSPRDDYSDYDDDYYDDDYDDRIPSHRRRRSWQREQYSPPPRTYRSLSPTESRYNGADTETDFSPPASPRSDRAPARPINEV